MKKFLTKDFAKILLIVGLAILLIGFVLTYLPLMNLYNSANSCLEGTINCDSVPDKTPIATFGSFVVVSGIIVFSLGIIGLLLNHNSNNTKK